MTDRGRAPVVVGQSLDEVDTPALILDRPTLDANIARIAGTCRNAGVAWRPHVKSLRSAQLARRLLEAGAIGVTVAKLDEAWAMADAGVDDILIANQVVGAAKITRLMALTQRVRVTVAVDAAANVAALDDAARAAAVELRVVIEVDLGLRRAGTAPGQPTVDLARCIAESPGLRFVGLVAWEGHTITLEPAERKRAAVHAALEELTATAEACRAAGLVVAVVSCSGTGSYREAVAVPGITEIQAGGGVLSDVRYRTRMFVDHPPALTVLTTVTSRPTPERIVCDGGRKSMSDDYAPPEPIGLGPLRALRLSAEHTTLELMAPAVEPRVGDHLRFVVGYGDTTVHLHDAFVVADGDVVVDVWPISERGSR